MKQNGSCRIDQISRDTSGHREVTAQGIMDTTDPEERRLQPVEVTLLGSRAAGKALDVDSVKRAELGLGGACDFLGHRPDAEVEAPTNSSSGGS